MKKAIFILGFLILATISFISVRAQKDEEEPNPECPNGCHMGGNGCYCYGWYAGLREHQW